MTTETTSDTKPAAYTPRDPVFFIQAACALAAALSPPSIHLADQEFAEKTGDLCARVLDKGEVPGGFVVPQIARDLGHRRYFAELLPDADPSTKARATPQPVSAVEKARRDLAALEKERGAPLPKSDELAKQNDAILRRLGNISEPVRAAALGASVARLTSRGDITGAREAEAIGVVVEEVLRAIRTAEAYEVHSKEMDQSDDVGPNDLAWPGNVAAAAAGAALQELREDLGEAEIEDAVAAGPAPAAPAPAAGAGAPA